MKYHALWNRLTSLYDPNEAKAIVRWVLEDGFGLSWADIVCDRTDELSAEEQAKLETVMQRLQQGEPVQYVLGRAAFGGRTFVVNGHVLIPRPETYELCQWILGTSPGLPKGEEGLRILDVGTGSGCIACTLAAELPGAKVTAWDISEEALAVAQENARQQGLDIGFERVDVLQAAESPGLMAGGWDIVVSNPPYICQKERAAMERNVLEHEPHQALFVPDDDPLLFYRAIAQYGQKTLRPDGWLYFEINPLYADALADMLAMTGYHDIETRADQFSRQRMTRAQR